MLSQFKKGDSSPKSNSSRKIMLEIDTEISKFKQDFYRDWQTIHSPKSNPISPKSESETNYLNM